ncbi:MAG: thioredoxin family protein [Bauldia sp.]
MLVRAIVMIMRITRRAAVGLTAAAFLTGFRLASAAERVRFGRAAFEAALKSGRAVLIDISASWCPTCLRQKEIVTELTAKPEFADYLVFEVDYDTEKDVMRSFGAQQRSTLIAFKNGAEVGRIVGDTSVTVIKALLEKAI